MPYTLTKLTPNLIVSDVARSVRFYCDVLGFAVTATVPEAAPYVFAIVQSGPVEVFLNAPEPAIAEYPAFKDRPIGGTLTLFIEVVNTNFGSLADDSLPAPRNDSLLHPVGALEYSQLVTVEDLGFGIFEHYTFLRTLEDISGNLHHGKLNGTASVITRPISFRAGGLHLAQVHRIRGFRTGFQIDQFTLKGCAAS